MGLSFDPGSHTYAFCGHVIPGVTRVLDQLGTYAGIPEHVLRAKADLGDAVHYATELHDRKALDVESLPPLVVPYHQAYMRFLDETGFCPFAIEPQLYSHRWKYAGTPDRVGRFTKLRGIWKNQGCLVDLKTTWRVMAAVGPQTAAYTLAWNEQPSAVLAGRPKVSHRFALMLRPDGTYSLEACRDPSDLAVFLAALTLYNWKAQKGPRSSQ